jgi:KaiC/GvpD/RAD55 family RecA-like ATPase
MSDLSLSPSQAKILEFLLANLLLAVRFSETSGIQTKNFFAVYGEKRTGKTAIVKKIDKCFGES